MKYWFIMPFNYFENNTVTGYKMERVYTADLSIKWVHGSIDEKEFSEILDKYFYFFSHRHETEVTEEIYWQMSEKLYVEKVVERINNLKSLREYNKISEILNGACQYKNIELILNKYFELKAKIESLRKYKYVKVIGHGDPCFSNTLYDKSTKLLKFIDPKGALKEDDLWTNPYYDIAKLSHSICGLYDFFNNGNYISWFNCKRYNYSKSKCRRRPSCIYRLSNSR